MWQMPSLMVPTVSCFLVKPQKGLIRSNPVSRVRGCLRFRWTERANSPDDGRDLLTGRGGHLLSASV